MFWPKAKVKLCKEGKMPDFGLAWRESGKLTLTVGQYAPTFGTRVPDVGPLNLKIVAWLKPFLGHTLFQVFQVPEKSKQEKARKSMKKPLKLVEAPMILNTFGTLSLYLSFLCVLVDVFFIFHGFNFCRSFFRDVHSLRVPLELEGQTGSAVL